MTTQKPSPRLSSHRSTPTKLPIQMTTKENVHLFLLAGQSNMAGRGIIADEDRAIHPRVFALTQNGEWAPAVDPIHWDKEFAGVGLGKSFALKIANAKEDITIGLIPAACGGSSIAAWQPGQYYQATDSHPYDDAIERTQRAMQDGVLKGILWHQGEGDCSPGLAEHYEANLKTLIQRFFKDLNVSEIPFLIGQLSQLEPWSEFRKEVNRSHLAIATDWPHAAFVRSDGLTLNSDNIHFDAASLREFGKRYADAYLQMLG